MEQVEYLLVVVQPASLRHDLGGVIRHVVLLVHLDLRIDLLTVQPFVGQPALSHPLCFLLIVTLELDLLLKAAHVKTAVQAFTF